MTQCIKIIFIINLMEIILLLVLLGDKQMHFVIGEQKRKIFIYQERKMQLRFQILDCLQRQNGNMQQEVV